MNTQRYRESREHLPTLEESVIQAAHDYLYLWKSEHPAVRTLLDNNTRALLYAVTIYYPTPSGYEDSDKNPRTGVDPLEQERERRKTSARSTQRAAKANTG
jgi:hypothetical protein